MNSNYLIICPNCIEEFKNTEYTSAFQYRGLYTNFKVPDDCLCNKCKGQLKVTKVTKNDIKILFSISQDNNFLIEMIKLAEENPIDYQLKMSQFKTQLEQIRASREREMNVLHCPKCGSTNITTGARGINAFWGPIGASKTVNRCANCGHTWKP